MGRKKFNMDPKKVPCKPPVFIPHHLSLQFLTGLERKGFQERSNICLETPSFPIIPPQWRPTAVLFFSSSPPGNPVPAGERPPSANPRRHCPVPLQRRGPQQDRHRRLLRRAVRHPSGCSRRSSLQEINALYVIREGNYGLDLLMKKEEHDWPPPPSSAWILKPVWVCCRRLPMWTPIW